MQINANKLIDFLIAPQGGPGNLQVSGKPGGNDDEYLKFSELLAGLSNNLAAAQVTEQSFMALSVNELNFLTSLLPDEKAGLQNPIVIPIENPEKFIIPETAQKSAAYKVIDEGQADGMQQNNTHSIITENILSGLSIEEGQGEPFDRHVAEKESSGIKDSWLPAKQSGTENGISVSNALKTNQTNGSPISEINSPALVEKGGPSSFQGLAVLSDLENLNLDERLVETIPSKAQGETAEISFTRKGDEQIFENKGFTLFEVATKIGKLVKNYDAALVKDDVVADDNAGMGELLRKVEGVKNPKAQLVLFPSERKIDGNKISHITNINNPNNTNLNEQFQNLDGLISSDAAVQIRKLHLQGNRARPEQQITTTENSGNGGAFVEAIVADDKNPKSGDSPLDRGSGKGKTFKATIHSNHAFMMDAVHEDKTGLGMNSHFNRMNISSLNHLNSELTSDSKQIIQQLPIEFKLEMPHGGEKIPESGYFRIKIQPESLGKIDVQLKVIGSHMAARMEVDTHLARQVVESNLSHLKETLRENGIHVENITVDVSTDGDRNSGYFDNQQLADQLRDRIRRSNAGMGFNEIDIAEEALSQMNRPTNLRGNMSLLA